MLNVLVYFPFFFCKFNLNLIVFELLSLLKVFALMKTLRISSKKIIVFNN